MATEYKYFQGSQVYAYPSANSDDGGDVNTEINLAGISDHLVCKNFILARGNKFEITATPGLTTFTIKDGELILEGRYVKFSYVSQELDLTDFVVDLSHNAQVEQAIISYINQTGSKKTRRENKKIASDNSPHLIFRLLKNVTGNMRGDLNVRGPGSIVDRVNRGVGLSAVRGSDLVNVEEPYVDLGFFLMNQAGTGIRSFVYNGDRFSYIDQSQIVTEDELTLIQYIDNRLSEINSSNNKITYVINPIPGDDETERKVREVVVTDTDVRVVTYEPVTPPEYDADGNQVVAEVSDPDKTYSIDEIRAKTHPASSTQTSPDNAIAHAVDPTDDGAGKIDCSATTIGPTSTKNNNGKSKLIARADHVHDDRYIMKSASGVSGAQSVGPLNMTGDLNVVGSISSDTLIHSDYEITAQEVNADLVTAHQVSTDQGITTFGNLTVYGSTSHDGNVTLNTGNLTVHDGVIKSETYNYIEIGGIRLYVSGTEPAGSDIPDGSIGIGW